MLETLEPRLLFSAEPITSPFARLEGSVDLAGQQAAITINLSDTEFSFNNTGIFSFRASAKAGSQLDPDSLIVRDDQGQVLTNRFETSDVPGSNDALLITDLGYETFTVELSGASGTTGGFVIEVELAGNLDGDQVVDADDLASLRSELGTAGTTAISDLNQDGLVTSADYAIARRNFGTTTSLSPMAVSLSLDTPADNVAQDGTPLLYSNSAVISGVAAPGAQVQLDSNDDGQFDDGLTTADPVTGAFSFNLTLAEGRNDLAIQASDTFGQTAQTVSAVTYQVSTTGSLFADPDLERAVQDALGISTPLAAGDLVGVTSLQLDTRNIDSLVGLEAATDLTSLSFIPASLEYRGSLSSLSPLTGLSQLETLSLQGMGIDSAELSSLSALPALETLDLRYNELTDLTGLAAHPALHTLTLHGNVLSDVSALAGKVIHTDLQHDRPDQAQTISQLAAALNHLPLDIIEWTLNNIAYQPYDGAMKGGQAVLQTLEGNDWDTASLVAGMLAESGINTRFVTGQVELDIATAMDYLGVLTPAAAGSVLANAGQNPITYTGPTGLVEAVRFDRAWLEAELNLPGQGLGWVSIDPVWNFKNYQTGVSGIADLVAFDANAYLSATTTALSHEFYIEAVRDYLAANMPGVGIADVAYDGPIIPQQVTELTGTLPYSIVSGTTIYSAVPASKTHRVTITATHSTWGVLFSELLEVPDISLDRINITPQVLGAGQVIPQLRVNDAVIAGSIPVSENSSITITVAHTNADGNTSSYNYTRGADQHVAVGLDASQTTDRMLSDWRALVNDAAIDKVNGQAVSIDRQVDPMLSLAVMSYFHETDQAERMIDGLTFARPVFNRVASGLTTADGVVDYFSDLPLPYVPQALNLDVANGFHQSISIDDSATGSVLRELVIDYDGSAQEHAVWERLVNTESISTIKSLQLAGERGIPVYTFNSSNAASILPLLQLSSAIESALISEVNAGRTVTVPADETPLNNWDGVGYISEGASSKAYIIFGGISSFSQSASASQGGSGTGDPNIVLIIDPVTGQVTQHYVGDPINVANGSVMHDETDFTLPNLGVQLTFARAYDSDNTTDRGMAPGWSYAFSDQLLFNPDSSITWQTDTGDKLLFTPDGGGFLNPATMFGTFTAVVGGYEYREKDGKVHAFDSSGRLVSITDRYGNGVAITRDGGGLIQTVADLHDPARALTYTYTSGLLTGVTDYTGRSWSFGYDASDRLSQVSAPTDANTPPAQTTYTYYDDVARADLLHTVTAPDGGVTTYEYYADRRGFSVTQAEGYVQTLLYDTLYNRTTYLDERGFTTDYYFNNEGNVTKVINPDGSGTQSFWSNHLLQSKTNEVGHTEFYQYDALGNLSQLTNRAGDLLTFTYEPVFSNLTQVELPGAQITQYDYDTAGNLISVTDPEGFVSEMTYDTRGNMLTQTRPLGVLTPLPGDYTTTMTYNGAGQILTRSTDLPATETFGYDAAGNLSSITDTNGNTTTFVYDLLDRQIQRIDAAGQPSTSTYDAIGNLIAASDELGRTTTFEYDLRQRLTGMNYADGALSGMDYDGIGNVLVSVDELGRSTATSYNSRGWTETTLLADGATELMGYDAIGRIISTTDPRGFVSLNEYDELDRLVAFTNALGDQSFWTYDGRGNVLTFEDENSNVTTYEYNLRDERVKLIDANTDQTTYVYDANGNLTGMSDPLLRTTAYEYDILDRRTAAIDPLLHRTETEYDAVGNVTRVIDALSQETIYAYDSLDRRVSETDDRGAVTTTAYDAVGNVVGITDPENNTTSYIHDARDRTLFEVNELLRGRQYTYDAVGNRVAAIDRNGRLTRLDYDARDRVVKEQWIDTGANLVREITSEYDLSGNLVRVVDPDAEYVYEYDALDRLTGETHNLTGLDVGTFGTQVINAELTLSSPFFPGPQYVEVYNFNLTTGTPLSLSLESSDFDAFLYLISPSSFVVATDDDSGAGTNAQIDYTIDETGSWTVYASTAGINQLGEYTLRVQTAGNGVPGVFMQHAYDAASNRTAVTDSLGGTTGYAYDALNRIQSINHSGTNIADKRVDFAFDTAGQIDTLTRFSDLAGTSLIATSDFGFDNAGRLTSLAQTGPLAAAINTYGYTYDDGSRITQMTSIDGTADFNYDGANQLTSADYDHQADLAYTYDQNGNRTNAGYSTADDNRLQSDGTYNYEYDHEGNRTRRVHIATGEETLYTWDHRNRLTRIVTKDSGGNVTHQADYAYDSMDRRIAKTVDSDGDGAGVATVERFVYDGGDIYMQFDGTHNTTNRYLHGPGADQIFADDRGSGVVRWALADHQGSIRDLLDETGVLVNHTTYDAFGNITAQTNAAQATIYGYTGRETDNESDLQYNRARYVDTAIGRFISQDPLSFEAGDTNLYRYVGNGPIDSIDPSGLIEVDFYWNGIAAHLGQTLYQDGYARQWYQQQLQGLGPSDSALRTRIKMEARAKSSPFGRAFAEWMRPSSGESSRVGGTANRSNVGVNRFGNAARTFGRVSLVSAGTIAAYNIATSDNPGRTAASEAGGLAGATAGGYAGAKLGVVVGGAIGGPVGAVIGAALFGIGGALLGGTAGSHVGGSTYDAF